MDIRLLIISIVFIYGCVAPPVTKEKQEGQQHEEGEEGAYSDGLENYMEYHRYLREVVNALESDVDFKKKLEKASEDDIRSGKIAHELEFVNHHVRTRLDEIKRMELDRLRELTEKKNDLMENNSIDDPTHHHLDKDNPHTFEIDDLKKLIAKTTEDLAEADRKRREEFKQYELQKEYEKVDKLNHTTGDERVKLEKEIKETEEKHKNHPRLHEPGHKQQLEEVWEEQDHMQQDFDPKTFFMLHDLDSNGLWDQTEVKALFIKELDKMYQAGAPEDDMRERAEEMERMREAVFKEVDTNRDGFIDFKEFLAQTKRNEFQQDHGWQGIDEQKPFTDEELEEYIRQYRAQQAYQQQHMPPPGMVHPGQVPPGMAHPGQVPPGMAHPGQVPPGYYPPHGNQVPPGGGYYPPQNGGGPQPPQMQQPGGGGYYPPQNVGGPPHPQVQAGQMPPQSQQQQPPQHINQDIHNQDQKFRQEQTQKLLPKDSNYNQVQSQQQAPQLNTNTQQQNIQPNMQQVNQPQQPQVQQINQPQQPQAQQMNQPNYQQPQVQQRQPNLQQPQMQQVNQPYQQQNQHPNEIHK